MRINIQFSGLFRAIAGLEQEILEVADGTTVDKLSGILGQRHPDLPLEKEKSYFVINNQVAARDQVLRDNDQVRIFRLLAGG